MWVYEQSSGSLIAPDGSLAAVCYSGHNEGVNNAADEAIPNIGPIPVGFYDICLPFMHPVCGPMSMRLEPQAGTDTLGRSGFLMHGDNSLANRSASEGCIVAPRPAREAVAASDDRVLEVVP